MGQFTFLGEKDMARAIYSQMKAEGLSEIEEFTLLYYLALPTPVELKAIGQKATEKGREEARRAVIARFPKDIEYAPTENRPQE